METYNLSVFSFVKIEGFLNTDQVILKAKYNGPIQALFIEPGQLYGYYCSMWSVFGLY